MSNIYPLKLAAMPEAWRLFSLRKMDAGFEAFKQKIFARDDYVCQYCGFRAKQYQEVVNLDNNYLHNKASNMITACCFCAQCFFLEAVGKDDYGGGVLIYLPEMSQNELNGFCHVLFCAVANNTTYSTSAQNIYRDLQLRAKIVEQHCGEGMSDATLFGDMLISVTAEEKKKINQEFLSVVRLLPLYSRFNQQVKTWSSTMQEELAV